MNNNFSISTYEKSGKILDNALKYGLRLIDNGVFVLEVVENIENYIRKCGAEPAFPVNIGINNITAHYTPAPNDKLVFKKSDIVKLDIGVHIDGYITDSAKTIEISTTNHAQLISASELCLKQAIEVIKPNLPTNTLGKIIEDIGNLYNYKLISNLTGHSISRYKLHSGKSIPNVKNTKENAILEVNDIIAIEPFVSTGVGRVFESSKGNIYRYIRDVKLNFLAEKLLQSIKERFKGLPFTSRWLDDKTRIVLHELVRKKAVMEYPILIEKKGSVVAQSEKTVLVTENGAKVLTEF